MERSVFVLFAWEVRRSKAASAQVPSFENLRNFKQRRERKSPSTKREKEWGEKKELGGSTRRLYESEVDACLSAIFFFFFLYSSFYCFKLSTQIFDQALPWQRRESRARLEHCFYFTVYMLCKTEAIRNSNSECICEEKRAQKYRKEERKKRETRKARAEGEGSRGKQSLVKATWTALFVPYLFALTHPVHPLLESRSDLTFFAVLRSLTCPLCTLSFRNKKRRRNRTKKCYAMLTTNQTYRFENSFLFTYLLFFSNVKTKRGLKKKQINKETVLLRSSHTRERALMRR